MGKTKEELKALFVTGYTPSQQDFADLIDRIGSPGPKGEKGESGGKGTDGKNGTNGNGVKSISFTVDGTGKITGGTWIGTDDKSNSMTIQQV